ncbi:hypothetical protein [Saccharococcus sp. Marseille-Q5394]|uniref:hypothetical protein n=1 Tax=Saccharococcus sp. Marseille-Q5394 TaxID=2972778 RepID=UPI0021C68571|nr:hypothetical protein [Saccharococcus sp. Marseille-Q5394]
MGTNLYNAEEVLLIIEAMEYAERNKLLSELAYKHFGRKRYTLEEIARLNYIALYGDEEEDEGGY